MILEFKEVAINLKNVESVKPYDAINPSNGKPINGFTIVMNSGHTHDVGSISKAEFLEKWRAAVDPQIISGTGSRSYEVSKALVDGFYTCSFCTHKLEITAKGLQVLKNGGSLEDYCDICNNRASLRP